MSLLQTFYWISLFLQMKLRPNRDMSCILKRKKMSLQNYTIQLENVSCPLPPPPYPPFPPCLTPILTYFNPS